MITGNTAKAERDRIIKDYKNDKIKCLINVAVLTTGFNVPSIDLVAFIRPTRSPVLYVQCVGRGMRTVGKNIYESIDAGKKDCLLLDFGGVIEELGQIDAVNIEKKEKGDGDAPIKQCPKCFEFLHAAVKECGNCGHEFIYEINTNSSADKLNVAMSHQVEEPFTVDVHDVMYSLHEKKGKTTSLKVSYLCGIESYSEWICFGHTGFARNKAVQWHSQRSSDLTPENAYQIYEFLSGDYPDYYLEPEKITVKKDGEYFRILHHHNLKKIEKGIDFEIPF
jgi:DNA repair protein RadD